MAAAENAKLNKMVGKVMWPVRIAVAGKSVTPGGAVELCQILGREESLRRIQLGLDKMAQ
jgi:glutamyl-tRNA synthetase